MKWLSWLFKGPEKVEGKPLQEVVSVDTIPASYEEQMALDCHNFPTDSVCRGGGFCGCFKCVNRSLGYAALGAQIEREAQRRLEGEARRQIMIEDEKERLRRLDDV